MKHRMQRKMFFGKILVLFAVLGCSVSVQNSVTHAAIKLGSFPKRSDGGKKTNKAGKPVVKKSKPDEVYDDNNNDDEGADDIGADDEFDGRPADDGDPDWEFDKQDSGGKKKKGDDLDYDDGDGGFDEKGDMDYDEEAGEYGDDVGFDGDEGFVDDQLDKIDKKKKKNINMKKNINIKKSSPKDKNLGAGGRSSAPKSADKKSKVQVAAPTNKVGVGKGEVSVSEPSGSSEKKASGSPAKVLTTVEKNSLLNCAGDFYNKNDLGKSSGDPIYFNYVDVDSGEKGARGSNRQIACGFFSPTYFAEKFQVGDTEDFSTAVFELEDSSGNKYVCNDSKYIEGPFPVGDLVAFKVFIGFDDLLDKKVKFAPGFMLKPGKEYVFRIWKGPFVEAGVDMKTGAVKEASRGELMAEVCGVVPVKNEADGFVEPFGIDGGIAGTDHRVILKKFAHPKSFKRNFFARKYKKIMRRRMESMRHL